MSPIPMKAGTYEFTPECLCNDEGEPIDGAPVIVLRHGTRMDACDLPFKMQSEGYVYYSPTQVRDAIIEETRRGWQSDDLEQNITLLEQYWQAQDDLFIAQRAYYEQVLSLRAEAEDDKKIDLPPAPELDFDKQSASDLDLHLAEVEETSRRISKMMGSNSRYLAANPRMILRVLVQSTTLEMDIKKKAGLITAECCEELLAKVDDCGVNAGHKRGTAAMQLINEGRRALRLTEDEVKNSSAPRSNGISQTRSAAPSKSKTAPLSKTPKSSADADGEALSS